MQTQRMAARNMAKQQGFTPTQRPCPGPFGRARTSVSCKSSAVDTSSRRELLLNSALALVAASQIARPSHAANGLPDDLNPKALCDPECVASLEQKQMVTLPSGLQYREVVEGKGPNPPIGFQVVCNYVAMTPNGRVFENSLDKGKPYDVRVGAGQVIPGLDEGLLTMRPGGIRRLYIPGNLAFPKGLRAAAGRPSVPPSSPVMFDVQLLYIPGLEGDDE